MSMKTKDRSKIEAGRGDPSADGWSARKAVCLLGARPSAARPYWSPRAGTRPAPTQVERYSQKMKERTGNVYENKGPASRTSSRRWNNTEKR